MAINTFQHDERTASGHRAVANQDAFYAITHPAVSALQRKSAEDEELQLKSVTQLAAPEEDELQMKSAGPLRDNTPGEVSQRKDNEVPLNANHTGMPDQLKSGIENLSGYSMDDVKVHYNSAKPAQLNALAYAQGTDIHVAPGQERHLPHEAWHVVQQKQGRVRPTMQMKGGVNVNDDKGLEHEADVMGGKALQFLGNPTKTVGQRKRNEAANSWPQSRKLKGLQDIVNKNREVKQLALAYSTNTSHPIQGARGELSAVVFQRQPILTDVGLVQRVRVGKVDVILSGNMPQWEQDGLTYHLNLTTDPPHVTCENWPLVDKKKKVTTKMHFFYKHEGDRITDAVSKQRGKKKFSDLPLSVQTFVVNNYEAILAVK